MLSMVVAFARRVWAVVASFRALRPAVRFYLEGGFIIGRRPRGRR
jgi:hypothetical protein